MRLPCSLLVPLVVLCLAVSSLPSLAVEMTPATACAVGQFGPVSAYWWIEVPNHTFYTLINPGSCACTSVPTLISMAHMQLYWTGDCELPVSVQIVGSTTSGFPEPANVLCPAIVHSINAQGGGLITHDLALSSGCCIEGAAFLSITFLDAGTCPVSGGELLIDPVPGIDERLDCGLSFETTPSLGGPHDPCQYLFLPPFPETGDWVMWADGDCCTPTPTQPKTWGSVKTLYR